MQEKNKNPDFIPGFFYIKNVIELVVSKLLSTLLLTFDFKIFI